MNISRGAVGGGGGLVSRVLDLNLHKKRRETAARWTLFNAALLLVFLYDLWSTSVCGGAVWWCEGAAAGAVCASLLHHVVRLLPPRTATTTITSAQQRLLGLCDTDLDSSFRVLDESDRQDSVGPAVTNEDDTVFSLSLSRGSCDDSPTAPPSPLPARTPASAPSPPPPPYRLSAPSPDPAPATPPDTCPAPSALHEARALAACTLNLRLWLHLTVVERLVREVDAVDAALGPLDAALGAVGAERALAAATVAGAGAAVRAVLPYLEGGWADSRYAVRRLRELSRDGALAGYRGPAAPAPGQPSDEELLHHWVEVYMRAVAAGRWDVRGDALFPVRRGPGHYEVGGRSVRGRGALLHAWLTAVAGAADRTPPRLGRTHLGPAGLNMLWILHDSLPDTRTTY